MISAILALLGSSAFGSIIGGIFAFLNKKNDLLAKKMDLDHEQAKWGHDLALRDKDIEYAKQELEGQKSIKVIETEGSIETARMLAIAQAQASDKVTADEIKSAGWWGWALVLASLLNRVIRPFATISLAGTAIYVNLLLIYLLRDTWTQLTHDQQHELGTTALQWIMGQAGAVLGYWFVSRGSSSK
jgi:hypothetical protein